MKAEKLRRNATCVLCVCFCFLLMNLWSILGLYYMFYVYINGDTGAVQVSTFRVIKKMKHQIKYSVTLDNRPLCAVQTAYQHCFEGDWLLAWCKQICVHFPNKDAMKSEWHLYLLQCISNWLCNSSLAERLIAWSQFANERESCSDIMRYFLFLFSSYIFFLPLFVICRLDFPKRLIDCLSAFNNHSAVELLSQWKIY